jgi:D-aminopeptidase
LAGGADAPAGYGRIGGVDQAVRGTARISTTDWTHLAMTYDGTMQRFYVNGVEVGTHAQTGSMAVGDEPLRIGGDATFAGEFFKGLIDEVKVYNRALTAAEINADMNAGTGTP